MSIDAFEALLDEFNFACEADKIARKALLDAHDAAWKAQDLFKQAERNLHKLREAQMDTAAEVDRLHTMIKHRSLDR